MRRGERDRKRTKERLKDKERGMRIKARREVTEEQKTRKNRKRGKCV